MILITGASGSGKSEYAENLAVWTAEKEPVSRLIYMAVMLPDGQEAKERIQRHREKRKGKGFQTIESPFLLPLNSIFPDSIVLLEDLGNLLSNVMFERHLDEKQACTEIIKQLSALSKDCKELIVVTNEIFSDGIEYTEKTGEYQKALGELNQRLSRQSHTVCEVVSSLPCYLKGERLCPL